MIKLKSADRIKIKTYLGLKEVKGELYRGFGINKDICENKGWMLTVITGTKKGWAIAICKKKNDCKLLADEIIKKINKTDIEDLDIFNVRDIIKKYMIKEG